jgi:hypothetical protein
VQSSEERRESSSPDPLPMPMRAVPASPMMVRTSAKSTLMRPGLQMCVCVCVIVIWADRVEQSNDNHSTNCWDVKSKEKCRRMKDRQTDRWIKSQNV